MPKIPLKAARVAAGLTQKELAEKMGVERNSVHQWEHGIRQMKYPYFKLFCMITGFNEDDIFLPTENATGVEEE